MKDKFNVILIVIDALRARNLGCYGGGEDASPLIDRMASQGILFENCFSCWNTTDQSLTSILTGMYPRSHGISRHGDKLTPQDRENFRRQNIPLLSERLKEKGFRTQAVDWMARWFTAGYDYYGYRMDRSLIGKAAYSLFTLPYLHLKYMAANIGLLGLYAKKRKRSLSGLRKGFLDVMKTFRFTFELARIQDAGFITSLARKLISDVKDENFFLTLHYWDVHSPYNAPRRYIRKSGGPRSPKIRLLEKYLGSIRYVDHHIGKLTEYLKEKGLLDDTLIIITSDHGESLTEHEIYFDHHGLYDVTTHCPLILFNPKIFPQGQRLSAMIQHIDLVPTVMELLGDDPDEKLDGSSLMPLIRGEKDRLRDYVFNEESYVQRKISLRTAQRKYIFAPDGIGQCNYCQKVHVGPEEFYDLEQDPGEEMSILDEKRKEAGEMRRSLEGILSDLDKKREERLKKNRKKEEPDSIVLNPKEEKKIQKRLRSLGYMD